MQYYFDNLKELKKHVEKHGVPAFAANADAEPSMWAFAETKYLAAVIALGLTPELILSSKENGLLTFKVKGMEGISNFDQFISGRSGEEAWDKLMNVIDDLMPTLPVSIFHACGDPLDEFLEHYA